jgi:hypothetical protein
MKRFLEFFQDDSGALSISRLCLFIGLCSTIFTATYRIDTIGEMTLWEAVGRGMPGLVGLAAYVFGKLYDARTMIAESIERIKGAKSA